MTVMNDTRYVEPTGLSSLNQSSARDLATLVKAAHEVPLIRELSTSPEYMVEVGNRNVQFRTTNGLVKSPEWEIGLQKTGYISEAGRCLVMQAKLAGRHLIMRIRCRCPSPARVAKLVDAPGLGPDAFTGVSVRVRPRAPSFFPNRD